MNRSLWLLPAALVAAAGVARAQPPPGTLPGHDRTVPAPTPTPPPDAAPQPPVAPPPGPPEEVPPPTTDKGAIEKTTLAAPTAQWSSWSIEGRLIDDPAIVRGFLEPLMIEHKGWSSADQVEVSEFLKRIGYHLTVKNESRGGGVHTTLLLEPVTLVRHVDVNIDAPGMWARAAEPIFADDLRRRMGLRSGSPLEADAHARAQQLANEANRLAQHLRNEGFYDVVVTAWTVPAGSYAAKVRVHVQLGVAYDTGRITIAGNASISSEEILEIFKGGKEHAWRCIIFCFGEARFRREQLLKDVERLVDLYRKRGFPGVRVTTDFDIRHSFKRDTKKVEFHVDIRERRKIDVIFEGNEKYGEQRLSGHLTIDDEGSYDDVEVEASAEALRRFYQGQGYFEAAVTWERARFGVFERIIFSIFEGPKLEVEQIEFIGNKNISTARLREEIVTKPYRKVIIGAGGGFATSLQLEQDRDRLVRLYQSRGYRDAQVELRVARDHALLDNAAALAAAVASRLPAEGLHVQFVIVEGPQHTIEDIRYDFNGPAQIDPGRLGSVLRQQPGKPFINEEVAVDTEEIRQIYYSRGYTRAEVESSFAPGRSPTSIVVTHRITPNSLKRVGKIAIRGNFKTREWVIRDEMRLDEGELLTFGALEQAQANLRSSGLFSALNIDYIGLEDPRQEVVNVLVQVEERHDNVMEAQFGGGYSTEKKFFIEAATIFANLFGTGTRFELRGVLGQKEQSIEARLAFPRWIMRRLFRNSFLLELTSFAKRDLTNERFGALITYGGSVAASKTYQRGPLQGLLLQLRYDFRHRQRDIDLVRPAGNNDDLEETKVTTRSSTIGPLVALDLRRDREGRLNPLLPERGFRVEVRAAYGEDYFFGTARFAKLGSSAQHFISLSPRFRLSNAVRYDHGIPLGGDVALPEVERYFAGGDTTVRGFEQDRLLTEVIEDELAPFGGVNQFRVIPAGGNIRFIHNFDIQARVWDDSFIFGFPMASAVFLDTGLVTNSLVGFEVRELRHSIGVALARVIAPFGAFSIEYAVPLDPQLGDDPRGRAHVNFGFLF